MKPKSYRRSKVESKTWTGIHVGYVPGDAYGCYIPEIERVFVSKGVGFIEELIGEKNQVTLDINDTTSARSNYEHDETEITVHGTNSDVDEIDEEDTDDKVGNNNDQQIMQPKRRLPWISGEFDDVGNDRNDGLENLALITTPTLVGNVGKGQAKSARDAVSGHHKEEWTKSMADKIISLVNNNVFDVVK